MITFLCICILLFWIDQCKVCLFYGMPEVLNTVTCKICFILLVIQVAFKVNPVNFTHPIIGTNFVNLKAPPRCYIVIFSSFFVMSFVIFRHFRHHIVISRLFSSFFVSFRHLLSFFVTYHNFSSFFVGWFTTKNDDVTSWRGLSKQDLIHEKGCKLHPFLKWYCW